jgi:poly(3-hydroxybutyrate) depolymerase
MNLIDGIAVTLLIMSAGAIAFGQMALARSDDFAALYWLVAGLASLAAAVQITRPGKA